MHEFEDSCFEKVRQIVGLRLLAAYLDFCSTGAFQMIQFDFIRGAVHLAQSLGSAEPQ